MNSITEKDAISTIKKMCEDDFLSPHNKKALEKILELNSNSAKAIDNLDLCYYDFENHIFKLNFKEISQLKKTSDIYLKYTYYNRKEPLAIHYKNVINNNNDRVCNFFFTIRIPIDTYRGIKKLNINENMNIKDFLGLIKNNNGVSIVLWGSGFRGQKVVPVPCYCFNTYDLLSMNLHWEDFKPTNTDTKIIDDLLHLLQRLRRLD